ncbi:hypothetical protein BJV78DRAFT_1161472, partial [Lactifluus subvellereus]
MATSFFRHFFIVFGARPGGALLGKPGAVMGAFTVSAIIHYIGVLRMQGWSGWSWSILWTFVW